MKKQFVLFVAVMFLGIANINAQDAQRQKMTPQEKTTMTMQKITDLNLDADAKAKTEVIFNEFYTNMQAAMQQMRASGNPDREAMKAKHLELANARDAKLKMVFTHEQMKKWINDIEPSLMPQRHAAPAPAAAPAN